MLGNEIVLPDGLLEFVQEQVAQGGYGGVSEYVTQLVESDRRKQAKARLEAELKKGLDSGPATEMTAADWRQIHDEVERRLNVSDEASEGRFTAGPALEALLLERVQSDQEVEVNADDWAAI